MTCAVVLVMKKPSKKTRNDAILILRVCASTPKHNDSVETAAIALGMTSCTSAYYAATKLALAAWCKVSDSSTSSRLSTYGGPCDAEAALLLEEGWSPS